MITLSNLDGGCVCVERDNLQWKRMSKQMKKKMFQSRDSPLKSSNFLCWGNCKLAVLSRIIVTTELLKEVEEKQIKKG